MGVQNALVYFITQLRSKYSIELLVVVDGLLPKYIG
jgi:hypothetical protein